MRLTSSNLPAKSNVKNHRGLDALTGKSNFDICEWIILEMLSHLAGRDAVLAMLCKSSVARKVLQHTWHKGLPIAHTDIYQIDSQAWFGAAAEACLLVVRMGGSTSRIAAIYDNRNLDAETLVQTAAGIAA